MNSEQGSLGRRRINKYDTKSTQKKTPTGRQSALHSPQRVQHRLAVGPAAHDGFVLDGRQVRALLEGREEAGHRDHQPGGLQAAGGPQVPAEAHPVAVLILLDELLVGRHP